MVNVSGMDEQEALLAVLETLQREMSPTRPEELLGFSSSSVHFEQRGVEHKTARLANDARVIKRMRSMSPNWNQAIRQPHRTRWRRERGLAQRVTSCLGA